MSECCQDCDFCEVMSDGFLFCALLETQVHGDQSCQAWSNDDLFIDVEEMGIEFGRN